MLNETSRKAAMKYVRAKRRAYAGLKTKRAKSAALGEFCLLAGAGRKYAIKLLAGNRKCRGHIRTFKDLHARVGGFVHAFVAGVWVDAPAMPWINPLLKNLTQRG